ncbi:MAG: GNAT family N-acetyltransferase [Candidatus Enterenecus sp.]
MESLHFVDACEDEHFRAMSLIHALGWRTTYQDAVPADYMAQEVTDDRWVPFFREDYETGSCHGLLLYRGDTPVSCCTYGPARVGPSPRQSSLVSFNSQGYEGWGEVISFYTHPEEKGKGYGSALMEEVLRRLRREGYEHAFVLVLRENENARRFYSRLGFTWDGTHEDVPFPHHMVCVDLRYVIDL